MLIHAHTSKMHTQSPHTHTHVYTHTSSDSNVMGREGVKDSHYLQQFVSFYLVGVKKVHAR